MGDIVKILYIGDIIGSPGRKAVKTLLPGLRGRYKPDLVIENGENAAGGFGITAEIYHELLEMNIDIITSGNHIWDRKEIIDYFPTARRLLRPAESRKKRFHSLP